jgi:hypothetical protein
MAEQSDRLSAIATTGSLRTIRDLFADQQLRPLHHELSFDDFGKLPHSG